MKKTVISFALEASSHSPSVVEVFRRKEVSDGRMQNVRFALRPVQRARAWGAAAERGSAGDAALWRADLTRTSQEDHCGCGGRSPEEQLAGGDHGRRYRWIRGRCASARQHPAWVDCRCRRQGAHGSVVQAAIQGI